MSSALLPLCSILFFSPLPVCSRRLSPVMTDVPPARPPMPAKYAAMVGGNTDLFESSASEQSRSPSPCLDNGIQEYNRESPACHSGTATPRPFLSPVDGSAKRPPPKPQRSRTYDDIFSSSTGPGLHLDRSSPGRPAAVSCSSSSPQSRTVSPNGSNSTSPVGCLSSDGSDASTLTAGDSSRRKPLLPPGYVSRNKQSDSSVSGAHLTNGASSAPTSPARSAASSPSPEIILAPDERKTPALSCPTEQPVRPDLPAFKPKMNLFKDASACSQPLPPSRSAGSSPSQETTHAQATRTASSLSCPAEGAVRPHSPLVAEQKVNGVRKTSCGSQPPPRPVRGMTCPELTPRSLSPNQLTLPVSSGGTPCSDTPASSSKKSESRPQRPPRPRQDLVLASPGYAPKTSTASESSFSSTSSDRQPVATDGKSLHTVGSDNAFAVSPVLSKKEHVTQSLQAPSQGSDPSKGSAFLKTDSASSRSPKFESRFASLRQTKKNGSKSCDEPSSQDKSPMMPRKFTVGGDDDLKHLSGLRGLLGKDKSPGARPKTSKGGSVASDSVLETATLGRQPAKGRPAGSSQTDRFSRSMSDDEITSPQSYTGRSKASPLMSGIEAYGTMPRQSPPSSKRDGKGKGGGMLKHLKVGILAMIIWSSDDNLLRFCCLADVVVPGSARVSMCMCVLNEQIFVMIQ